MKCEFKFEKESCVNNMICPIDRYCSAHCLQHMGIRNSLLMSLNIKTNGLAGLAGIRHDDQVLYK